MTFRQLKANVKLRRTLIYSSMFMIAVGLGMFSSIFRHFAFTSDILVKGAVAYALSMAGAIAIFYSVNYTRKHTICVKCRKQVDTADFMNMENFKCPHCNFECDADDPIW